MHDVCQRDEITLLDDECKCYEEYLDSKEYQEEYWRHCRNKDDGKDYKVKAHGKKFVIDGMTLYSGHDDRYGYQFMEFTEKRTGYLISGKLLSMPDVVEKIKAKLSVLESVDKLPEGSDNT